MFPREQVLPYIQIQLQRDSSDFGSHTDLPSGNGSKATGGLQKTFSKLTSRFTKKTSCTSSNNSGNYSIPNIPSKTHFITNNSEDKAKLPSNADARLQSILNLGNFPRVLEPAQLMQSSNHHGVNGLLERQEGGIVEDGKDAKGMNLPTDQEMQEVIDFLSGFNMGKSQQTSPLIRRRTSVASSSAAAEQKAAAVQLPSLQSSSHTPLHHLQPGLPQQPHPQKPQQQQQQQQQHYQPLRQPIGSQQRLPSKWPGGPNQPPGQTVGPGLSSLPQWGSHAFSDLSSDLYSLGLVNSYMDNMMSEMLGQKPQGPRNNTWPNRDQSDGIFGVLGEFLPFDPAGEFNYGNQHIILQHLECLQMFLSTRAFS